MPLLDSNLWAGTDPRLQQQAMGGMGPGMGAGGGVPQLPPTLAAQLAQRAQMRMSPQSNPMLAATMRPPQQPGMDMMPPFQPTPMAKPKEFWEQQYQPNEGMRSMSVADTMPKDSGVVMPGQLPQMSGPQIPNNAQGMGLGANAPQMMGGMSNPAQAFANQFNAPGMAALGMGQNQTQKPGDDSLANLKNQMFGAYLNLYPEGNI